MSRFTILIVALALFSCTETYEDKDRSDDTSNELTITILSDKSVIFSDTKVNIHQFDSLLKRELDGIDVSNFLVHLKVSKKVNIRELSSIKDSLKERGIKRVKYEPFTEEEELFYQV